MKLEEIRKIKGLELNHKSLDLINTSGAKDRISLKCKYLHRDCVLRIFPGSTHKTGYLNELFALRALKENGLSVQPEIHFLDDDKQLLILEYVLGKQAGKLFTFSNEFIGKIKPEELVDLLIEIKKIKVDLINDKSEMINFYEAKLKYMRELLGETDRIIVDKFELCYSKYIKKDTLNNNFLSHGDINPGNIFFSSSKIKLIDWELAKNDSFYRDFSYVYYLSFDHKNWAKKFIKYAESNIDSFEMKIFNSYLLFSLAGDAATFKNMILTKNYSHFRSGRMSLSEINRLYNRNILKAREI